jgi:hypothetical protein
MKLKEVIEAVFSDLLLNEKEIHPIDVRKDE